MNKTIRNIAYNYFIQNTPDFYRHFLHKVPKHSIILEVGIGNGCCLPKNVDLIKRKDLRIDGIDIDTDYLEECEKVIYENDLEEHVTSKHQDLLTMKPNVKYDYIIFTESYPVIPLDIMKAMMRKCRKLLKPKSGKVCFIHNLEKKKEPIRNYLKPKLKDILLVDFGRLTTDDEFNVFLRECRYKMVKKELIETVSLSKHFSNILLKPYDDFFACHQYYLETKPL